VKFAEVKHALLTSSRILRGIHAGCRACLLLKKGIEHFQPLQHFEQGGLVDSVFFAKHQQEDDGWIVTLPPLKNLKVMLEFTESFGKDDYFHVSIDIIVLLMLRQNLTGLILS
jgi:hypothetical protein